jgi:hypothetical protein
MKYLSLMILYGSLFSVNSFAFTSSFQLELFSGFSLSEGRTSGHEELTRQALNTTKELLKLNKSKVDIARGGVKLLHDLDFSKRGVIGALAKNPIIKGVYCSDFPDNKQCLFSLSQFWFSTKNVDWHNGKKTQSLHFLRDYDDQKGLVSPYKACMSARERIVIASQTAAVEWQKGNVENALFLIGHASHIIQDSFSHAHVKRESAAGAFKIKDICYYGVEKKQELLVYGKESLACFHPTIETSSFEEAILGDSIWIRTDAQLKNTKMNYRGDQVELCSMTTNQYIFDEQLKLNCLNLEARLGRDATVKYFYLMAQDFYDHRQIDYDNTQRGLLAQRLNQKLFEGTESIEGFKDRFADGIARCDHLAK